MKAERWIFVMVGAFYVVVVPIYWFMSREIIGTVALLLTLAFFGMLAVFFTVQSNILVAITTGMLAVRLTRSSTTFRVLRLTALIAITITGIVYHLALAGLQEMSDKEATADWVLHTASPILCLVGWLMFGPRGQVTRRVAGLCVTFPLAWLAYTLIRGELVDDRFGHPFYPYPFLDVAELGYGNVAVSIALIAALFAVLALLGRVLDRRLSRNLHPRSTT